MSEGGRRVHVIINARSGTPGKESAAERVSQYCLG